MTKYVTIRPERQAIIDSIDGLPMTDEQLHAFGSEMDERVAECNRQLRALFTHTGISRVVGDEKMKLFDKWIDHSSV